MSDHQSNRIHILLALALAGCKANVNIGDVTDTSPKDTDVSAGDTENGSGAATTGITTTASTGTSTTTGEPSTSGPASTSGPNETTSTSGPVQTTGTDTSADPSASTSMDPNTSTGASNTMDVSSSTTGGGNGDLGDWTKYREVLIDNGLPKEFKDFQVAVNVDYDNDMAPDYADLRFTDATGTIPLPYWIERDTGPVNAFIWVRVPTIAPDDITTIRMYYGNPNAAPGSNGFDTFLFFDDFEGAILDATKWKTTAPVEVNFGQLLVTKGVVYTAKPASAFPDTWAEARMTWHNEGGNPNPYPSGLIASQGQAPGPGIKYLNRQSGTAIVFDGQKFLAEQQTQSNPETPMIIGIAADGVYSYFNYNRGNPLIPSAALSFTYYLLFGHPYGKTGGMENVVDVDVDWVLVRRFAKTDPATLVGGEKSP